MEAWQDPKNFAIWLTIVLVVVVTLILCIIVFTRLYYKRILQANARLSSAKLAYQKALLSDSVAIQEQERKRVAMELHDNLISKLNTILFAFKAQSSGFKFEDLLEECVHTTREISHDLSPPLLEHNSIAELIEGILEPLKTRFEVEFSFQTIEASLSKENKLQVLRITQEVINNIIKHAQASSIQVLLRVSTQSCSLVIIDNGIGFSNSNKTNHHSFKSKGLGLKNIELRAQILRGQHRFSKLPKQGTSFILSFSLNVQEINDQDFFSSNQLLEYV